MSKTANNKKKKSSSNKILKLEEKNKVLETEIKDLKNKNIALLAEFDNYKKAPRSVTDTIIEKSGLVAEPA